MKKTLLSISFFLFAFTGFSQEKKEVNKSPWSKATNLSLLFNQAAFNDSGKGVVRQIMQQILDSPMMPTTVKKTLPGITALL